MTEFVSLIPKMMLLITGLLYSFINIHIRSQDPWHKTFRKEIIPGQELPWTKLIQESGCHPKSIYSHAENHAEGPVAGRGCWKKSSIILDETLRPQWVESLDGWSVPGEMVLKPHCLRFYLLTSSSVPHSLSVLPSTLVVAQMQLCATACEAHSRPVMSLRPLMIS